MDPVNIVLLVYTGIALVGIVATKIYFKRHPVAPKPPARYLIFVERTETGWSAYCPALPGCVATGRTLPELEQRMEEAIELHRQS